MKIVEIISKGFAQGCLPREHVAKNSQKTKMMERQINNIIISARGYSTFKSVAYRLGYYFGKHLTRKVEECSRIKLLSSLEFRFPLVR